MEDGEFEMQFITCDNPELSPLADGKTQGSERFRKRFDLTDGRWQVAAPRGNIKALT